MAPHVDPNSFMECLFIDYISTAVPGGVAVYVGAYVAPRFKKEVSLAFAALIDVNSRPGYP